MRRKNQNTKYDRIRDFSYTISPVSLKMYINRYVYNNNFALYKIQIIQNNEFQQKIKTNRYFNTHCESAITISMSRELGCVMTLPGSITTPIMSIKIEVETMLI